MRITQDQARKNRGRALDAAAELFREKGFDAVGVAEVMHAAGMTHGGFYNHFDSKEALEAETCKQVLEGAQARLRPLAEIADADERRRAYDAYRRRYVSKQRRDAPAPLCPMIAFASDMPRRPEPTQKAFADGLAGYLDLFCEMAGALDEAGRLAAIRDYATLFGALALARSVARENSDLSDEILHAAGGGE